VRAIAAGHDLRMQSFRELEWVLQSYAHRMSDEVLNEYLKAILELFDSSYYRLPW